MSVDGSRPLRRDFLIIAGCVLVALAVGAITLRRTP
jgi:hypothetical protein